MVLTVVVVVIVIVVDSLSQPHSRRAPASTTSFGGEHPAGRRWFGLWMAVVPHRPPLYRACAHKRYKGDITRAFLSGWQGTRSSAPTSLPASQPTIFGNDAPWQLHTMGQFAVPSFAYHGSIRRPILRILKNSDVGGQSGGVYVACSFQWTTQSSRGFALPHWFGLSASPSCITVG